MEEWDDLTLMNELINRLNQQLPIITDETEKEECLQKIYRYTERFEALQKTNSKTIKEEVQNELKEDKNKTIKDSDIEWNDMENLNRLLKDHEVSLAQSSNRSRKEIRNKPSNVYGGNL